MISMNFNPSFVTKGVFRPVNTLVWDGFWRISYRENIYYFLYSEPKFIIGKTGLHIIDEFAYGGFSNGGWLLEEKEFQRFLGKVEDD